MKKTLKLKPFVLPMIYSLTVVTVGLSVFFMAKTLHKNFSDEEVNYVSNSILDNTIPVMSEDTVILKPYTDTSVKVGKFFYNYQDEKERQQNSIVYHENTYMQNSGIDFVNGNIFDIISVLDGTVINVKDDELLGKTVEIRHNNDLISVYQSLSEVTIKKDDEVIGGQVIGKSGENELDKSIGNHLHFELYYKGQIVNPEDYFNKKINDLKES